MAFSSVLFRSGVHPTLKPHATNLVSNRSMRPDCSFVLSEYGLDSLADAGQRDLREGHNWGMLYMSGEFNE